MIDNDNMEQLYKELSQITIVEMNELIKKCEEEWGVSATSSAPVSPAGDGVNGVAEEKSKFDVKIISIGENKMVVIKCIKGITNKSLKEAKSIVDSAPAIVLEEVSKQDAEDAVNALKDAGAEAEYV